MSVGVTGMRRRIGVSPSTPGGVSGPASLRREKCGITVHKQKRCDLCIKKGPLLDNYRHRPPTVMHPHNSRREAGKQKYSNEAYATREARASSGPEDIYSSCKTPRVVSQKCGLGTKIASTGEGY